MKLLYIPFCTDGEIKQNTDRKFRWKVSCAMRLAILLVVAVALVCVVDGRSQSITSAPAGPWIGRHFSWRQGMYDPQNPHYWVLIHILLWGFLSLAAVTAIISISFCICRYYFNGCGGKSPKQEGYTFREQRSFVIALCVVAAFALGGVIDSLVGENLVDHKLRTIFSRIDNSAKGVSSNMNFVISTFAKLNSTYVDKVKEDTTDIFSNLVPFEIMIFWANFLRGSVGFLSFLSGTVSAGLAINAAISRRKTVAFWMGIVSFISTILFCVTCGLHLSLNVIADDACDAGQIFTTTLNYSYIHIFDNIFNCSSSDSMNSFLENVNLTCTTFIYLNQSLQNISEKISLNMTVPNFTGNTTEMVYDFIDLRNDNIIIIQNYLDKNNMTAMPPAVVQAISYINASLASLSILSNMVNCQHLIQFVSDYVTYDCEDFVTSITFLWVGCAVGAIACFAGGFIGLNASKRFMRQNYSELAQYDDFEQPSPVGASMQLFQWTNFDLYDEMRSRQRLLEAFCIVQGLIGAAHLAFIDWEDEPNYFTYTILAIVGGFTVISIVGFILTKLRAKWGVLLFAAVEIVMMFAFVVLIYGLSANINGCVDPLIYGQNTTNILNPSQIFNSRTTINNNQGPEPDLNCPTLYHKSTYVIGEMVIVVDILFLMTNVGLASRLFYIIHTGKTSHSAHSQQHEQVSDIFSEDEVVTNVM